MHEEPIKEERTLRLMLEPFALSNHAEWLTRKSTRENIEIRDRFRINLRDVPGINMPVVCLVGLYSIFIPF